MRYTLLLKSRVISDLSLSQVQRHRAIIQVGMSAHYVGRDHGDSVNREGGTTVCVP